MSTQTSTSLEKIGPAIAVAHAQGKPRWRWAYEDSRHYWRKYHNSKKKTLRTHRLGCAHKQLRKHKR